MWCRTEARLESKVVNVRAMNAHDLTASGQIQVERRSHLALLYLCVDLHAAGEHKFMC